MHYADICAVSGVEMMTLNIKSAPLSKGLLRCTTEKEVFLLNPSAAVEELFTRDDNHEDNIHSLEEGKLFGIEITCRKDVTAFS